VYFTKSTITQASRAIPIAIEIQKATVFLFGYSLNMCCGMMRYTFIQLFTVKVSSTCYQNQALPPYFGQYPLQVGKQLITGDQGTGFASRSFSEGLAQGTGLQKEIE